MTTKKAAKGKERSEQESKARVAERDRRRASGVRAQISIDDVRAAQKQLEEQEARSVPPVPRSVLAEVQQRHAERTAAATASAATLVSTPEPATA